MEYLDIQNTLRREPRRWLVTGVAGFIGSNLLETLLNLDQTVVGLDNFETGYLRNIEDALARARGGGRFRHIEGDIRDPSTCRAATRDVDIVLHQAALGSVPRSILEPETFHRVNVDGFVNLALAARQNGVKRFVYASSSAVYGDHEALPKSEDHIGAPLSPYALTKHQNEQYADLLHRVYGLETVGLRYFNVYGRRQDPRSTYAAVIPNWVHALLRGERCAIFGDGETTRDFCYIDDVVQANLLAALRTLSSERSVYNVGGGARTSLNDLFEFLRGSLAARRPELADVAPEYQDFRPGDVRHSQADISAICADLGFRPTHALEKGLEETLDWYVTQLGGTHAIAV
jgi:UDP-N-acetylglucosamine 4-epimerase